VGIRCADHVTRSTRKSRHYFADSGGRSVGIVRLRTKATEFLSYRCHSDIKKSVIISNLMKVFHERYRGIAM
jgi:hypothetical protein